MRSPYRRNPDADLRELERQALANPDDENAQLRYHHALARTTDHSPACSSIVYHLDQLRDEARYERVVADYTTKWPKHCVACGGRGGQSSSYDPSPGGIGLSAGFMVDFDHCQTCVEQSICPRCGENTLDMIEEEFEDYFRCSNCDWNDREDAEVDGLPEVTSYFPECDCWEFGPEGLR